MSIYFRDACLSMPSTDGSSSVWVELNIFQVFISVPKPKILIYFSSPDRFLLLVAVVYTFNTIHGIPG